MPRCKVTLYDKENKELKDLIIGQKRISHKAYADSSKIGRKAREQGLGI